MKKIILLSLLLAAFMVGCKGQAKKACDVNNMAVKSDTVAVDATEKPITALFTGMDKKGGVKYTVQVIFYPVSEKAVVTEGANTYVLTQYVTADGYGYRNDALDLRGKGSEATMTFSDKKMPVIYLTEKK